MDADAGVGRARPLAGLATTALTIAAGLALLALLLYVGGYDAPRALAALWTGSVGSSYALISGTLVRATPLILTGLSVALAFRAGVWNIGAEGQLLVGATAATTVALGLPGWPGPIVLLLALILGAAGGALWAWIAAALRERYGVLEVISTIMLNFVALYLVGYLVRGPLQEPTHVYPQSAPIPDSAQMPALVPGSRLHWGLPLAVGAGIALWWIMRATAIGFRLRTVGANPRAAASAGEIDVGRVATRAFLASGALAGLAGAVELTGVTYALYESLSPGYGYTAIAVALLARLDPLGVVAAGILFGALEAGGSAMQRDANVPSVLVSVIEALLILLVLAADRIRGRVLLRASLSPASDDAERSPAR